MAKHAQDKKPVAISDSDREEAYGRIKPLTEKACNEIDRALGAVKPCAFCLSGKPKKTNEAGNCVMCDGKGMVPDHDQRKWGATEVLIRVAPAPKSVEMKLDDKRDLESLAKEYEGKSPEEIKKALEALRAGGLASLVVHE